MASFAGKDIFAILVTGYGENLCYVCLPLLFDHLHHGRIFIPKQHSLQRVTILTSGLVKDIAAPDYNVLLLYSIPMGVIFLLAIPCMILFNPI